MVVNMVVQMKERIQTLVETNRQLTESLGVMNHELLKAKRERDALRGKVSELRSGQRANSAKELGRLLAQLESKLLSERQRNAHLLRDKQDLLHDIRRDRDRFERAKQRLERLNGQLCDTLRERDEIASELHAATSLLQDVSSRLASTEEPGEHLTGNA